MFDCAIVFDYMHPASVKDLHNFSIQIKVLNIQVATILSNNTSLVYRQCLQHGVVFDGVSRAHMVLPLCSERYNCFCRIFKSLHVPTWFLSLPDWLCISFWRTGLIPPSVRISRRQISCQETYFDRVASASLPNYHRPSLTTYRVAANMFCKAGWAGSEPKQPCSFNGILSSQQSRYPQ